MTSDEEDVDVDLRQGFLTPHTFEEKQFKYIGVMVWHQKICRYTITLQQLEGIVLETLQMEPFFICLRQSILKTLDLPQDYNIYLEINISTLKNVLKSKEFYYSGVPKNLNGRSLTDNISLLETVVCIYKLNLLRAEDIKSIMIAFDLLSKHNLTTEVFMQNEFHLDALQESLRFINRAISPKLVIDWCLRCYHFLDFSRSFHNPQRSKNPLQTRRFVIQKCRLKPHEFLSMMCNSVDRQQMLLKVHKPDFSPKKIKISEEVETTKGEFRMHIYSLDLDKKNFVEKRPTELIIEQLNETFHTALHPDLTSDRHEFRHYYGLIEAHPQFTKDTSGLPILDKLVKHNSMTVNIKNAMVKNIEKKIFESRPDETELNYLEVDLADAVVQANKSLNKITKVSPFVQIQQNQTPTRNNINQTSAFSFKRVSTLSKITQVQSQEIESLSQRQPATEFSLRTKSRGQIMSEVKSIPYFKKEESGFQPRTVSFSSPSNQGLKKNVEAVCNRRNVQQFQGTGPGQLVVRMKRALVDQQIALETGKTLDGQQDTRQEFIKIKMNLLSDLREAQRPMYLRKSGIRNVQRQIMRTIEAREERLGNQVAIKELKKNSLVQILKDRGFNVSKRTKTAAEQEKEELCKSKPRIQGLFDSQSQFNQTMFQQETQSQNFSLARRINRVFQITTKAQPHYALPRADSIPSLVRTTKMT